jgi:hypothetical protein
MGYRDLPKLVNIQKTMENHHLIFSSMNKIVKLVELQTGKGLFHHRAAITRTGFDRQGLVQPWAL